MVDAVTNLMDAVASENGLAATRKAMDIVRANRRQQLSQQATDALKKIKPHQAIVSSRLLRATRKQESYRHGDFSIGDPKDKLKEKAYQEERKKQKLPLETAEELFARRGEFRSWGPLQVGVMAIQDVNEKFGTKFTHEDAFDIRKASTIYQLYAARYSRRGDTNEQIARRWVGGPDGATESSSLDYWRGIQKMLAEVDREDQRR